MRTARPCGTTPSCKTPSTTTPTSPRELHQSLPVPAGSLRHPAAPAGALAKSTGGIGLRSAIKVIQDVLKGEGGSKAMADQPVGWLATTVTLYDELEKDIRRAFPSVHQAVGKVQIRFPDSGLHQDIAKTVAVLQILATCRCRCRTSPA
jgi:hypothetical protein